MKTTKRNKSGKRQSTAKVVKLISTQSATKSSEVISSSAVFFKGTNEYHLPNSTNSFFKARMGHDFSNVIIHTDEETSQVAGALNAAAFTIDHHIGFAAGMYNPFSNEGKQLLAHELTHVKQNTQSATNTTIHRQERARAVRPRERQALIEALMSPESPLWRQLNPHSESPINCPATAAAVAEYLRTGQITPAPGGDSLSSFEIAASSRMSARIDSFDRVRAGLRAPNSFAVVRATRGADFLRANPGLTPSHFFTAVNYRGNIVLIDAYGNGGVIRDVDTFLRSEGFEYYNTFHGEFRVIHHGFDDSILPE